MVKIRGYILEVGVKESFSYMVPKAVCDPGNRNSSVTVFVTAEAGISRLIMVQKSFSMMIGDMVDRKRRWGVRPT